MSLLLCVPRYRELARQKGEGNGSPGDDEKRYYGPDRELKYNT